MQEGQSFQQQQKKKAFVLFISPQNPLSGLSRLHFVSKNDGTFFYRLTKEKKKRFFNTQVLFCKKTKQQTNKKRKACSMNGTAANLICAIKGAPCDTFSQQRP